MLVSLATISVTILSPVSCPQYWTTSTNVGLVEDVSGKKVPVTSDKYCSILLSNYLLFARE